jgi:2-succinyl-5-enolpyruvyl-6-hydroxy-3-cyclohexene-1-carboxylate synthase
MNAQNTAQDADLEYFKVNSLIDLEKYSGLFFEKNGKSKLIEIETDSVINTEIFKQFKVGF